MFKTYLDIKFRMPSPIDPADSHKHTERKRKSTQKPYYYLRFINKSQNQCCWLFEDIVVYTIPVS